MNFSRLDNVNPIYFLENGAAGILTKKMESEELLQAIEWVRQGEYIYRIVACVSIN
jgi:DNA-binding NarL/FixJ family response regulator